MISTQSNNSQINDVRIAAFLGIRTKEVRKLLYKEAAKKSHECFASGTNGDESITHRLTLEANGKKYHIDCAGWHSLQAILDYFSDFNERYMAGREQSIDHQISELNRMYPRHREAAKQCDRLAATTIEPYYK